MKGNVSPELHVPEHILKPNYYEEHVIQKPTCNNIEIKNSEQIIKIRKSCKLAAKILQSCKKIVKPGVTTDEIDKFVHNSIISHEAYPSPLRYCGFPKSICTSINNVACHGIPDDRPLEDGDIVNVDITVRE